MIDKKNDISLLKAIIKAELTQSDIKIILHLMAKPDKSISISQQDLASQLKMKQSNFARSMKKLVANNVIGFRKTGLFLRSKTQWKADN